MFRLMRLYLDVQLMEVILHARTNIHRGVYEPKRRRTKKLFDALHSDIMEEKT